MTTPIATVNNDDDLVNVVTAIAHENGEKLRTMSQKKQWKFVRREIKAHEVAWVAWTEGEDLHCVCIKGRGRLGVLTTTAFRVESRIDAIAVAEELGDGTTPELGHAMPAGVM
jgi:hypothetical protein